MYYQLTVAFINAMEISGIIQTPFPVALQSGIYNFNGIKQTYKGHYIPELNKQYTVGLNKEDNGITQCNL